ncbi:hypothetical protein OF83DRAFT_933028 [Amylostereum chailletii]|nr:hypothetical protein OF83DRAFT_933028 [Amylostereum chailletii]
MGKRRRSSPPDDPDLEHQDKRSRHVSRSELDDMEEDLIMSPHIRFQSCSLRESSMNSSIMFDWLMQDADINTRSGTGLSDEHWQRRSLSYASAADPAVDQTEEDQLLPSEHASQPTDTFEPNTEVTGNPGSDDGRNTSQTEDLGQAARAPRPSSPEQPPQPRPIRPRQFPPIGSQFYRQSFRGNNDRVCRLCDSFNSSLVEPVTSEKQRSLPVPNGQPLALR